MFHEQRQGSSLAWSVIYLWSLACSRSLCYYIQLVHSGIMYTKEHLFSRPCFVIFLELIIAFVLCIYDTLLQPFQWISIQGQMQTSCTLGSSSVPGGFLGSSSCFLGPGLPVSWSRPRFGNVYPLGTSREGSFPPPSCVIGGLTEDTILSGG